MPTFPFCRAQRLLYMKKESIENVERRIRRYFAQSRVLSPKVWGPPTVLHSVVETYPSAVVQQTLFPPPLRCSPSMVSMEERQTVECRMDRSSSPSDPFPMEKKEVSGGNVSSDATAEFFSSCSSSSSSLGSGVLSSVHGRRDETQLYSKTKLKSKDVRVLSSRYCNPLESSKDYGMSEVGVEEMFRSVNKVWSGCEEGWREVMRHAASFSSSWTPSLSQGKLTTSEVGKNSPLLSTRTGFPTIPYPQHSPTTKKEPWKHSSSSFTLPRTVLFLVLFSTARHQIGCGETLHSVGQQVKRILEDPHNFHHFSHVFRVVIVSIGIQAPFVCPTTHPLPNGTESFPLSVDAEELEVIQFPHAGLYTFQAALTSIASLRSVSYPFREESTQYNRDASCCHERCLPTPDTCIAPGSHREDSAETVTTLRPCVHVVTDGWLLPRSCVDALQTPQCPMHVFPAVVSNTLSAKEVRAFSRSIACEYVSKGMGERP